MLEPLANPIDPPLAVVQADQGLNIQSVPGAKIYAVAAGRVLAVVWCDNCGLQISVVHVRCARTYESVYSGGQPDSAAVKVGDMVQAGQALMKAESGLRLTMKCYGATARGETSYARDRVDPAPFFLESAPPIVNAPGKRRTVTATPHLHVRLFPQQSAKPVGELLPGQEVVIVKEQGAWGFVTEPVMGWLLLEYTE